jgi:hypothetical protein
MKGDLSRQTFDAERHYSSVRLQQGRVQLDADFNEQADIGRRRAELDSLDVIGPCGGPLHDAAFGILLTLTAAQKAEVEAAFGPLVAGDFVLTPGRYYVDGIVCENDRLVPFTHQPHLPGLGPLNVASAGFYIVYLDVWQRHVTALEDPSLRETALGGPDTATRSQTVWQVRTVFAGTGATNCLSTPAAYNDAIAPSTGTLAARARPEAASSSPCIVPQSAGYRGLENQLYRVEIFDGGKPFNLGSGTDFAVTDLPAPTEVVVGAGTWNVGQAVEVFSSAPSADRMTGTLAHVVAVTGGGKHLTLSAMLPSLDLAVDLPRVRKVEATYVWSRDNGSVASLVRTIDDRDVVMHDLGPDDTLGFQDGDWVQLSDTADELNGRPGQLLQIEQVLPATNTLRLRSAPGDVAVEDPARGLKVRRWHGAGAVKVNAPAPSDGFAALEDGVEVQFGAGTYRSGDYWTAPARTATADAQSGSIEWPSASGVPEALLPFGIEHHYCKVAVLQSDGSKFTVTDCRSLFPPVTELATLVYVGGDGQEAMPGDPLPQPLEAGVFRGQWPVAGAPVKFTTADGGALAKDAASLPAGAQASVTVTTGADGVARCAWRLAPSGAKSQRVTARWLDAAAAELPPVLDFYGSLSIAAQVAYQPGACADLASAKTVQEALDILCARPSGGCCVCVTPDDRLDEVIKKLLGDGARDICVCLTGGDHKLEKVLEVVADDVVLKIAGCGAGSRLHLPGGAKLGRLEAATLRDLDIVIESEATITVEDCDEVALETCTVWRAEPGRVLVHVHDARGVRVEDCRIDAAVGRHQKHPIPQLAELLALPDIRQFMRAATRFANGLSDADRRKLANAIKSATNPIGQLSGGERRAYQTLSTLLMSDSSVAPELAVRDGLLTLFDASGRAHADAALVIDDVGAQTHITGCQLIGTLAFYGAPDDATLNQDQLAKLSQRMATGGFLPDPSGGAVHLTENRLTRVAVGEEMMSFLTTLPDNVPRLPVIGSALISDNVIDRGGNLLLCDHLALTTTAFAADDGDVGAAITGSSIFTANHAPNDVRLFSVARARAVAANLTLNIVNV